ncbi:hypothetical protein MMF93_22580 [Streptomyces tubbatahanensis]|uniref:Uncharacterized protein n=1 Tax=Streptomyces tubbatahanensis TaxID=2923272 RepID=A0ABY3XX22_9ACTN|nr:hypothetical protein [Streptomyces tubbatahanensis]UNS98934.1 hypothetical protein MMF93_22580 [Streptomyces tubbatahanensis]
MEQRPDTAEPAVLSAGTDPTFVPGLDTLAVAPADKESGEGAASSRKPDTGSEDEERTTEPAEADHDDADSDSDSEVDTEVDADTEADSDADEDEEKDEDEEREEEPPEGPSFEVSDRRSAIIVDGRGVTLRLDDAEAAFEWSEIGAVEIGAPRFGRRFRICVCTTGHRRFDAEVEAPSRKQVKTWSDDLDSVLDTWFDDSTD